MNILQRIKNQLKSVIDDIHNNYEAKIEELRNSDCDSLVSYESYDTEEDKKQEELYQKEELDQAIKELNEEKWHCIRCGYLLKFVNYEEALCTNKECNHHEFAPLTVRSGDSYSVGWEK